MCPIPLCPFPWNFVEKLIPSSSLQNKLLPLVPCYKHLSPTHLKIYIVGLLGKVSVLPKSCMHTSLSPKYIIRQWDLKMCASEIGHRCYFLSKGITCHFSWLHEAWGLATVIDFSRTDQDKKVINKWCVLISYSGLFYRKNLA